jgi:uncharacterized membrane protein YdjX (TVP38/TMEM64 family)
MLKRKDYIKLLILMLVMGLIICIFAFSSIDIKQFTPSNIRNYIARFGAVAPAALIVAYVLRSVILVIPVSVLALTGGLAFGTWQGWLIIHVGAVLGSSFAFVMARYFGREMIESSSWYQKKRISQFDEKVATNGFKFTIIARLIPLFQYDALNFSSGLSKMKFKDYFLGTLIGMAPHNLIGAMLGSEISNMFSYKFLIPLTIFFLLALVPLVYDFLKKRKLKNRSESTGFQRSE